MFVFKAGMKKCTLLIISGHSCLIQIIWKEVGVDICSKFDGLYILDKANFRISFIC